MQKYLCIHGHFYQPPRENPWLEAVELQDSAAPFHDWNERITAECYGRNSAARILDHEGRIQQIISNYSKISFNFGPTLLAWMKEKMPWMHDAIVEADKLSQRNFSGHGSALAQVYNHMIMPLANERDRHTQILWGIRDFESRFGREPEGMWLSETAADSESLDALAAHGIKFTILSPFQAKEYRSLAGGDWEDVNGGKIDPARPYLMNLPSGRSIVIFFYDAPVSQAVAFEKLLDTGEKFAGRLVEAFSDARDWDQLVLIATDGESYGHHHRRGEMALAYALEHIQANNLARLTNYGEYLSTHPPTNEVRIHEKSAWSCSHGVGRWMENCGCNSGRAGWHQEWRAPLRHALDWLRDQAAPAFERGGRKVLKDPWQARDDYISVILNRNDEHVDAFLLRHAAHELSDEGEVTALKLLELQRHAMLMYTSCGWFFDELSGIETVQVIQYAGRVIQLANDVLGLDLEEGFLERLQRARSNLPVHRDGRRIYTKFVKPAMISWDNVIAHFAISSIFHGYEENPRIFLYRFHEEHRQELASGRARLIFGRARVSFIITREARAYNYAALYLGEHHVTAGVKPAGGGDDAPAMPEDLRGSFNRANFPDTIRILDRHFGPASFSLRSLFKDEQRRILDEILSSTRQDLESRYRLIAERYTPLVRFLEDIGTPLPQALRTAVEFILHTDILRELKSEQTDYNRLERLLEEARLSDPRVFDDELGLAMAANLFGIFSRLNQNPADIADLERATRFATMIQKLPMDLDLWRSRNLYWKMLRFVLPEFRKKAKAGDEEARRWTEQFLALGEQLSFSRSVLS